MRSISINDEFTDLDQFNSAVAGWDLEFRQLQRGSMIAGVAQCRTDTSFYNRVRFSQAIAQSGAPAARSLTFGIIESAPWAVWGGHELKPGMLLRFHSGHEFESVSSGGFSAITLSFDESALASMAERLGHPDVLDIQRSAESAFRPEPGHLEGLYRLACQALLPSTGIPPDLQDRERHLDANLATELVTLLARCQEDEESTLRSRSRIVRAAIKFILANAHDAVTVADVCTATSSSVRTLDRAFRERLGASPKNCIIGVRLRGARRELQMSDSATRVADVANRWGFWHLGDFARVYRREFRELPSQTLPE